MPIRCFVQPDMRRVAINNVHAKRVESRQKDGSFPRNSAFLHGTCHSMCDTLIRASKPLRHTCGRRSGRTTLNAFNKQRAVLTCFGNSMNECVQDRRLSSAANKRTQLVHRTSVPRAFIRRTAGPSAFATRALCRVASDRRPDVAQNDQYLKRSILSSVTTRREMRERVDIAHTCRDRRVRRA
jgi:hypothetical protein